MGRRDCDTHLRPRSRLPNHRHFQRHDRGWVRGSDLELPWGLCLSPAARPLPAPRAPGSCLRPQIALGEALGTRRVAMDLAAAPSQSCRAEGRGSASDPGTCSGRPTTGTSSGSRPHSSTRKRAVFTHYMDRSRYVIQRQLLARKSPSNHENVNGNQTIVYCGIRLS